jgi:hypothetical protein
VSEETAGAFIRTSEDGTMICATREGHGLLGAAADYSAEVQALRAELMEALEKGVERRKRELYAEIQVRYNLSPLSKKTPPDNLKKIF